MSPVRQGARPMQLSIPYQVWDAIDGLAEALDVETGIYIAAVLEGALRSGNADRHAIDGLAHIEHKRRARKRRAWTPEGRRADVSKGGGPDAACWRFGEWTLVRLGHPGPFTPPDEGWFLEGPGLADAVRVGVTRNEAFDEAEPIIRSYERAVSA